jgi:hypothetical protein
MAISRILLKYSVTGQLGYEKWGCKGFTKQTPDALGASSCDEFSTDLGLVAFFNELLEIQRLYPEVKSGIACQTGPSREVPHRRIYEAINFSNLLQARIAANMMPLRFIC